MWTESEAHRDEIRKVILDYLSTWVFSYVIPYITGTFTINDGLLEAAFRGIVCFTILVRRTTTNDVTPKKKLTFM